jgi:hypothetical protein
MLERWFARPVRVARSRRLPIAPEALWVHLQDPRAWAPFFVTPLASAPKRVKLLDAEEPETGGRLQVLRSDRSWVLYEIERWEPARQVRLVAKTRGHGQEEGRPIPGRLVERLILIPQGSGSEAEWTVDHDGALLSRLLVAPNAEAWSVALDARLDALDALAPQ